MESKIKYNLIKGSPLEQSDLFNKNLGENFSYKDIMKLQESEEQSDFLKNLNFHKKKIHSILYDEDKSIKINDIKNGEIISYIYLCFLLEDNSNIVNYEYDFELINKLNIKQTKENNNILKKIIISKLINILSNNYNGINNKDKINKIKVNNEKVLKENIKTLKKYNLNENDIYQKKIEEIYLEIIKTLIKKPKLDEDIFNIFIELEFESISSDNIINELNKIIDKKEEYIKKYEISEFNDLFSNKMSFYYILIKYIFKPCFINKNTFLNETNKTILNLIKANIDSLYRSIIGIKDGNLKEKVEYVLKSFLDNRVYQDYYKQSESKYIINNDKSYPNLSSNPASNSIVKEAQSQSNKTFDMKYDFEVDKIDLDLAYRVLIKSTFKFHIKGKGKEADIKSDEIEIEDKGDKITFDEIKNYKSSNTKLNDKFQKFLKKLEEMEDKMKNEIENGENLKIILEFSRYDSRNTERDNIDELDIKCIYKTENSQISETYEDDNILENWTKEGLSLLIDSLNEQYKSSKLYKKA